MTQSLQQRYRSDARNWRTIEGILLFFAYFFLIATVVKHWALLLCLLFIAVSRLARFRRRQFLQVLSSKYYEVKSPGPDPYVLFLRPFSWRTSYMSVLHQLELTDVIAQYMEKLHLRASVVAIKDPRGSLPLPGTANVTAHDELWKEAVGNLARNAIAVVLIMGKSPGVQWEAQMLRRTSLLNKSIFVSDKGWFYSPFKGRSLRRFVAMALGKRYVGSPSRTYSVTFPDGVNPVFQRGYIPLVTPMADTYNLLRVMDMFFASVIGQWRSLALAERSVRDWAVQSPHLRMAALRYAAAQVMNCPYVHVSSTESDPWHVWIAAASNEPVRYPIEYLIPLMLDYLTSSDHWHVIERSQSLLTGGVHHTRGTFSALGPRPQGVSVLDVANVVDRSGEVRGFKGQTLAAIALSANAFFGSD